MFDEVPGAGDSIDGPLTEAPSPIVIEAAPLVIPGEDGEVSPEVQEAMAEHLRLIKDNAAAQAALLGNPQIYAGAGAGLTTVYNASYEAPVEVQAVIDAAVATWSSVLATNPAGPAVIEVFWSDLENPSLLGYAGPDGMFYGGGLPTDSLYPAALTNTLLGLDANGPTRPEVQVVLNKQLHDTNRWYLGSTGDPSGSQVDLFSVVLHEVGHGLGFLGSAHQPEGQIYPRFNDRPYTYDDQASFGGQPVLVHSNAAAALTSGEIDIAISEGQTYEVYAPNSWTQGSSFSHFDEGSYPAGSAGAMMTPMLMSGETARTIDAPVLGVMARMGWPITAPVITPSIESVNPAMTAAVISWSTTLGISGLAPDSYTLEAWRDGSELQTSIVVAGGATSATVPSLSPGQTYTIKVIPNGPNGPGAAVTTSVELGLGEGPADPSTWPTYIRNTPLDGQINRLYQAYFLRLADPSGFDYWLDQRASWVSLTDISAAFAASAEFQNRYGSLSDEAFVDLVYANVLGRVADAEGRAFWLSQLSAGTARGDVMIGFAESNEYVTRTGTAAPTSVNEARIERLYQAFFGRAPDVEGLDYWTGEADRGVSLESIADAFAQSTEFQATYGPLDDQAFVELVYVNVLGRSPDAEGLAYWTGLLAGGLDRGTAMVGFSESSEFVKSTGTLP